MSPTFQPVTGTLPCLLSTTNPSAATSGRPVIRRRSPIALCGVRNVASVKATVHVLESEARRSLQSQMPTASVDEVSSGMAASVRRRASVRLACTQAAQSAAQAVDLMYNAGGGTSRYESSRLERSFRDVHACTQHIATSTDSYEAGGRVLLGLDPGRSQF